MVRILNTTTPYPLSSLQINSISPWAYSFDFSRQFEHCFCFSFRCSFHRIRHGKQPSRFFSPVCFETAMCCTVLVTRIFRRQIDKHLLQALDITCKPKSILVSKSKPVADSAHLSRRRRLPACIAEPRHSLPGIRRPLSASTSEDRYIINQP